MPTVVERSPRYPIDLKQNILYILLIYRENSRPSGSNPQKLLRSVQERNMVLTFL